MAKFLRVLFVEDKDSDVELLIHELSRGGYTIEFMRVETAEDMRNALGKKEWDIIFSDNYMPRFNVMEALNVLQEIKLDIPFILVSGSIGEEKAVETLKAGVNDYILKDNLRRLIPAIERELREAEERRARRKAEESLYLTNQQLKEKIEELQRLNKLMIGREDRILELKNEIAKLKAKMEEKN